MILGAVIIFQKATESSQALRYRAVKKLNLQNLINFSVFNFYLFEQVLQFFDKIDQNGHQFDK